MNRVQILLSTYNGEKYLVEQLDSLVQQTHQSIQLLIRDDGSTDSTCSILSEISEKSDKDISIIHSYNAGVVASFLELLNHSDGYASYYSFCDQDDVWKPDKLTRATAKLEQIPLHIPAMYCSRTELVDEGLNHLGYWPLIPSRGASFANALIENLAVGCTVVMNRAARELIVNNPPGANKIIMHDWWSYLCISAFGQIIYDAEPSILYRQHSANVTGGTKGFFHKWLKKFKSYRKNSKQFLLRKQADEFYRLFGKQLSEENRRIIERFLNSNSSFYKRAGYFFTTELYRHSFIENYLFRLMYLFNKI